MGWYNIGMAKEQLMDGGGAGAALGMEGAVPSPALDTLLGLFLIGLILDEGSKVITGTAHS